MKIDEIWVKYSCEQSIDKEKTGERIIYKNGFIEAINEVLNLSVISSDRKNNFTRKEVSALLKRQRRASQNAVGRMSENADDIQIIRKLGTCSLVRIPNNDEEMEKLIDKVTKREKK